MPRETVLLMRFLFDGGGRVSSQVRSEETSDKLMRPQLDVSFLVCALVSAHYIWAYRTAEEFKTFKYFPSRNADNYTCYDVRSFVNERIASSQCAYLGLTAIRWYLFASNFGSKWKGRPFPEH